MSPDPADTSIFGKIAAALDRERSRAGGSILESPPNSPRKSRSPGEPIATPTIAEIYLRQGLPHRAVQVYKDLLSSDPGNAELMKKVEDLEEHLRREELEMCFPPESEAAAESSAAVQEHRPSVSSAVDVLTRWIEAIQRRRQHVQ